MPHQFEQLAFSVDGVEDSAWQNELQEIIVDNTTRMPSMCTINLYDRSFKFIEGTSFQLGKAVKIFVRDAPSRTLFNGEITIIEPVFEDNGRCNLMIHAYDKSHRMHRGKKTRTFTDLDDAAIIKKMLGENGLTAGSVDNPQIVHEFVLQNNQTNMEWIAIRAEQLGYQFYVEDDKFYFKKADYLGGKRPVLSWGHNLRSFRPRHEATHQPTSVKVYSWDPTKKQKIVGVAKTPSVSVEIGAVNGIGGKAGQKAFADRPEVTLVNTPVTSQKAAESIASGYFSDVDGTFLQAEGVAFGDAEIKVGHAVELKEVGPYSGNYFVSSVRHVYRRDGAWETSFGINGRNSATLFHLLDGHQSHSLYQNRINGVVPAIVTNLKDPKNWGRVKVKYPWMPEFEGKEIESNWVRIAAPGVGASRGIFWLPEVNDEVLVTFEHGDPQYPYIVGGLWNGKDLPPEPTGKVVENGRVVQRVMRSRSGHIIVLNDSDSAAQIVIRDKTQQNEIVIDSQNNDINVKAQKNISIEAGGNITIKANGKILMQSVADTEVKAGASLKMSANAPSELKVTSPLKIEAAAMEVRSMSTISIQGNAMAELKSSGIVNIQGTLIKLN